MATNANIISNKKNTSVVFHFVANSGAIVIAGNNSVSNVATDDEVIVSASITQVIAGSPSGNAAYWEIKRGANTVLVIDSTCQLDFAGAGLSLTVDATANLSANLVGSTAGFLTIELQKKVSNVYA